MRLAGALLLSACGLTAAAEENPQTWLAEMAEAVQVRHYEGTLVYFHDGKLEAMRLIHKGGTQGGSDYLVSLSGETREIIREGEVVKCFLPGQQAVIVERGRTAMPIPARLPLDDPRLETHYRFLDLGEGRVAGRECRIVGIKPVDEYRYGYRLCLDRETALPLKSELMSPDGEVVEQVMFTSLRLHERPPAQPFEPSVPVNNFTWHVRHGAGAEPGSETVNRTANAQTPSVPWQAGELPPGFVMTHEGGADRRRPAAHLVYSDGLASVSVFAEPAERARKRLQGAARMGAVNVYGRREQGWQLTVVGEVPPATVELIGKSLERVRTPSPGDPER